MRVLVLLTATFALMVGIAQAQWREHTDREWRFVINFPADPRAQDIAYASPGGTTLKARAFSVVQDRGRYSLTVVDYSSSAAEEGGAIAHAAAALRRKGMVQYDAHEDFDGIPGHQISVIEPNGWRMRSGIFLHDHRLYIVEGSAAPGMPPPAQFHQSLEIIDANGEVVDLEEEEESRARELRERAQDQNRQ